MCDACGEYARLARARARQHQHRPVEAFHCLHLLGVQPLQIALVGRQRRVGARGNAAGAGRGRQEIVVAFKRIGHGGLS